MRSGKLVGSTLGKLLGDVLQVEEMDDTKLGSSKVKDLVDWMDNDWVSHLTPN